ncbi:bifunctional metallophosphatase/5'-nucleotidase, partial [Streptomyces albidoflavus]
MSATPRTRRRTWRLVTGTVSLAAVGALVAAMPAGAHGKPGHGGGHDHGKPGHGHGRTVDVQLLSFNDLHGNLEPPAGSSGQVTEDQHDGTTKAIDAGGAEYLATSLRTARKGNPY